MQFKSWSVVALLGVLLLGPLAPRPATAQLDPALRDAVIPAAVQVALPVIVEDDGDEFRLPFSLGSGTIISADGLVLTNQHVVDPAEQDILVSEFEARVQQEFPEVTLRIEPGAFTLLSTDGGSAPEPLYEATVVAADEELDLAVLRIVRYDNGDPITAPLSFIPLGDSDAVALGDPLRVFSYPAIGEDSLTYTTGVVSGFVFDEDTGARRWITTDTVISGGSSGGTAVNAAGELIGIPTAGTELDCRPGDTNRDGVTDDNDVGCIPTGGSLGRLVPVNVAADFVAEAARAGTTLTQTEPTPTAGGRVSIADAMATAAASARQSQPDPTPTPAPLPDETPVTRTGERIVLYSDDFAITDGWTDIIEPNRTGIMRDGVLTLTVDEGGKVWTFTGENLATNGANARFTIEVAGVSGDGETILLVRTAADEDWYFAVDEVRQTWSLYRGSVETGDLFYWVEPISYEGQVRNPVQTIAFTTLDGRASLALNGVDVVTGSGIPLPEFGRSVQVGFGVSTNFADASGVASFSTEFEGIELIALD